VVCDGGGFAADDAVGVMVQHSLPEGGAVVFAVASPVGVGSWCLTVAWAGCGVAASGFGAEAVLGGHGVPWHAVALGFPGMALVENILHHGSACCKLRCWIGVSSCVVCCGVIGVLALCTTTSGGVGCEG